MPETAFTARQICEDFLDITRNALLGRDRAAFVACFDVPHYIETYDGCRILRSSGDLEDLFDGIVAHLKMSGITDMQRTCLTAEYSDPDTIVTVHESQFYRGQQPHAAPLSCLSHCIRVNGIWRISRSQYSMQALQDYSMLLAGRSEQASRLEAQEI